MRYLGGKSRIARHIAPFIGDGILYEPFVGAFNIVPSCNVSHAVCSDIHPGLIRLYKAVQQGWVPPDTISHDEYHAMKAVKDDSPLGVFASFAASFGGKEWGGFARDRTGKRDLSAESAVAFRRKIPFIKAAEFHCLPYYDVVPYSGSVLYCDPPYKGTVGYKTGDFNTDEFVLWCNYHADRGVRVLVSEFHNPDPGRWAVLWQRCRKTSIDKNGPVRTEMLLEVAR